MNFSDLTWNPDNWNEELQQHVGFQAQYEAENGWLICISAYPEDGGEALTTATGPDQKYSCSVWSWDRAEGDETPYSNEDNCTSARAQDILTELGTYAGEVFPETTTTTAAPGPSGQWD